MDPVVTLVEDNITPTLERYAEVMGRTMRTTVRRAARGVTRRIISIPPPASAGTTGRAAYQQGRQRIASDLSSVLAPVKLKGRRVISMVFGRPISHPVTVPTTERYPDVEQVYASQSHFRGRGLGFHASKHGNKFFVDARKFRTLLTERQARVGRLASGWLAPAQALDVPVPAWVVRHGSSRGAVRVIEDATSSRITAVNYAPGLPANVRSELKRRIGYAMAYQRAAMRREIDHMVLKNAGDSGITTTRSPAPITS